MIRNIIIDFDSTIVADESLEVLFSYALKDDPLREETVQKIAAITAAGMNGDIPFDQSLSQRIALLPL
jgi:D-3-phosphoglycerate dehydrogenase